MLSPKQKHFLLDNLEMRLKYKRHWIESLKNTPRDDDRVATLSRQASELQDIIYEVQKLPTGIKGN
jgi:hypothetical protein